MAALLCAAAGVAVLLAPAAAWMYGAFALLALADAGIKVSRPSLAMDLGAAGRVATYTALTTTLLAAPALVAPIAGGWLIDTVKLPAGIRRRRGAVARRLAAAALRRGRPARTGSVIMRAMNAERYAA